MAAVRRMTQDLEQQRASSLAREALSLADAGQIENASRKLREAATFGHDNPDVQTAFLKLHQNQDQSPLLVLCRRYAQYNDRLAGAEAARYLTSNEEAIAASVALESLKLILDNNHESLSAAQDTIIAELVHQCSNIRHYFASQLQVSSTEFFDNIYERGDRAANCLRVIVLDAPLWKTETDRLKVEADLFQLLLAKLMESGHDLDGRALKGLALLIVADPINLHPFVDDEGFDAILSSLDVRLPTDVRSQATLTCSKYLEVSGEIGRQYFASFVTTRVAKQKHDGLIEAFSAAAGLFPIAPIVTAPLFLTEGFLQSVVPLLERKFKGTSVASAFLQLLNAACIDSACRSAIAKYCSPWLSHMVSNGKDNQPALAATVLAKLRTSLTGQDEVASHNHDDINSLVRLFKDKLNTSEAPALSDSIEGLAYASLQSEVKDDLAKDPNFLKSLFRTLRSNSDEPDVVIGGLNIITNLTQYRPRLSDESTKMAQLRAYANVSKPAPSNVLDDDDHVLVRCNALVEANVLPVVIDCSKGRVSSASSMTDKILLSLSKNQKTRGQLAQQGAVKLLLSHIEQRLAKAAQEGNINIDAAHALARILISVDPALVFPASGLPHVSSAVRPLVGLLSPATTTGLSDQARDLLPSFEGLLALTNLASTMNPSVSSVITRSAWDSIQDLLLSTNEMIRRASCELVCNLAATDACQSKFADGSPQARQRVHTLLGLADVDDVATRRAASGALAVLTQHSPVVAVILQVKRGVEILLALCEDDDEGLVQRGVVCLANMLEQDGEVGERAKLVFKAEGGLGKLQASLQKNRGDPSCIEREMEVIKSVADD